MQRFLEDLIINKLYGVYLTMVANEHPLLAAVVYRFSQGAVFFLQTSRLIPKRVDYKKIAPHSLPRG